ncbi:MAG: IS200/IS605 family transposase [Aeriscardovia sp.]|nr:IS200/IS605 family transposase [Aeriscardovia sp.]
MLCTAYSVICESPPFVYARYIAFILTLLVNKEVIGTAKTLSATIARQYDVTIPYRETDRDRIHYMLQTSPAIRLSGFVRTLKSCTSCHLWGKYPQWLASVFYRERTFWSDGYFISSIGEVSSETLRHCIENQGKGD